MRGANKTLLFGVAVLAVVALGAGPLRKLPADITFPLGKDSPGKVVFKHDTHVDKDAPDCTGCHPQPYRITEAATADGQPLTHAEIDEGRQCGSCHGQKDASGKLKAFGLKRCDRCHIEEFEEDEAEATDE